MAGDREKRGMLLWEREEVQEMPREAPIPGPSPASRGREDIKGMYDINVLVFYYHEARKREEG